MPLSNAEQLRFKQAGAPTWTGTASERLVEVALTCEPEERYSLSLFKLADRVRNERDFRKLISSGIMDYVNSNSGIHARSAGPVPATLVNFTPEGLAYVTQAIEERIPQLVMAYRALKEV